MADVGAGGRVAQRYVTKHTEKMSSISASRGQGWCLHMQIKKHNSARNITSPPLRTACLLVDAASRGVFTGLCFTIRAERQKAP